MITEDYFHVAGYLCIWILGDTISASFLRITLETCNANKGKNNTLWNPWVQGGGGIQPIFGYRWAAEGLKPWRCLEQKALKT